MAAALSRQLRKEPGIVQADASPLTGRVLIRFNERRLAVADLLAMLRPPQAAQPGYTVSSLAPLGRAQPEKLLAIARSAGAPSPRKRGRIQWATFAGRRGLRRLGPSAFRTARAMQRRGERVLCLLKDGRPQGLVGVKAAPTANLEVAATVEAGLTAPPAWHTMPPVFATELLGSDEGGLSVERAGERLARDGPNALLERPGPTVMQTFLQQFREPMVLVLLGAALLSFLLGERIDAVAIVAIVVINALLGAGQELKSRQAVESLKRMTAATARVSRSGQVITVRADQLVCGDLVLLEAGDVVPADLRLLEANALTVEEAALTGESGVVAKEASAVLEPETPIGDRRNMLYMGTFVRSGRARGMVVATGMATEMGRIALLLQADGPGPTPLQRKLAQVNRILVISSLVVGILIVTIGMLQNLPPASLVITAISTAVAAIPEGLPITVTIALALAVFRMGKRNAVVRHLPAVETLGSTMVICTDKTGTLTMNRMEAQAIWAGGTRFAVEAGASATEGRFLVDGEAIDPLPGSDLTEALRIATLCTNATLTHRPDGSWSADGDPTEAAILVAAARAGLEHEAVHRGHPRIHEVPFEAATRSMTVVCRDEQGRLYAHVKGAPDKVLTHTTRYHLQGRDEPLTATALAMIEAEAEAMAAGGLRVLALAYRQLPDNWHPSTASALDKELVFAGLIGLADPPRPEVREALASCRSAGVRVMMVTGDHQRTAMAIARELGMAGPGDTALTGGEIERMTEPELAAALSTSVVCARVAPEQKLRIVRALRSQGKVVAMTGDGVNDAPAIREADIGIAMGLNGTEVTRSTADMVLLDDNFATIVGAIEEGRGTYDNIRRTVRYTLATNIAEVVLMLGAVLAGVPLPLLPVHLLWVNLVCDGVPALSLAFDRPAKGAMGRPPRRAEEGLFAGGLWRRMTARGVALGLGTLLLFGAVLATTGNVVLARSTATASLVASKLAYLFEVRRDESGRRGLQPNPLLAVGTLVSGLLCLGALYLPGLQYIFRTTGPGAIQWLGVGLVTLGGVLLERIATKGPGKDCRVPAFFKPLASPAPAPHPPGL